MSTKKIVFQLLCLVFFLLQAMSLLAEEPMVGGKLQANPIFQDDHGLAIHGYDAVAYFSLKKPVQGKNEFQYKWMGATWMFASAENRDAFIKDPNQYAPQYGGYCAYGMSHGYAVTTEPDAWRVVDGKLYLNHDLDVQKKWNEDIPGFIKLADDNWPKIPKKQQKD
ncbi:MAG: hypothetical protein C5B54_02725 [Acidobacteria bacterium]|nr:MAG: hypothetical protein C5B54_02725 [Acidobacteriota bacterium]